MHPFTIANGCTNELNLSCDGLSSVLESGNIDIRDKNDYGFGIGGFNMKTVEVQNVGIPSLGLGTYSMKGDECRKACLNALEMGYRHFDTAQMYNNERPVGNAVRQSDVPRDNIFVVTKILRKNLAYDDVLSSFRSSRSRLGLDYTDLLLIHAPSRTVPIEESISAMNELHEEGVVKHIGVSNFSVPQTQEAIKASNTPILTNQVKYHPFKSQHELLQFSLEVNFMLTAHTPLARTRVSGNDKLDEIGEKHGKTPVQVTLRWLIQQPLVSAIPKSSNPDHQMENMDIFDFELSEEEMKQIFDLGGGLIKTVRNILNL